MHFDPLKEKVKGHWKKLKVKREDYFVARPFSCLACFFSLNPTDKGCNSPSTVTHSATTKPSSCSIRRCANKHDAARTPHRFDLIYLLLDKFDEEKDLRLARHLISLYHPGATTAARPQGSVVSVCVCGCAIGFRAPCLI